MEYGINGKWNTVLNSRKYYVVEHLDLLEYIQYIKLDSYLSGTLFGGVGRGDSAHCYVKRLSCIPHDLTNHVGHHTPTILKQIDIPGSYYC